MGNVMDYMFGDCVLNVQLRELRRAGVSVPLRLKVFQLLTYLLAQRDRVVPKQELLAHLWPNQFVGDAVLLSTIREARQAVGDSGRAQCVIQTQHGYGYRFIAPVVVQEHGTHAEPRPAGPSPAAARRPPLASAPTPWRPREGCRHAQPGTPLVGRDRELALLHERLRHAASGQGQVVSLVGDRGMGKSRLLAAFRASLEDQAIVYREGRCLPGGSTVPYLPIQALLRQACGLTDTSQAATIVAHVRHLLQDVGLMPAEHAPYLLQFLGVPTDAVAFTQLDAQQQKRRTFALLHQIHLHTSQRRPLVLAIEDLHWIDPASEEYLASLVEHFRGAPLLLLVTYRPGYQPLWLEHAVVTQLTLPRLLPDESAAVIQAVLQTSCLPAALLQTMLAQADGNPLALEELARAAAARQGHPLP